VNKKPVAAPKASKESVRARIFLFDSMTENLWIGITHPEAAGNGLFLNRNRGLLTTILALNVVRNCIL
jgi:hypothetical protein